MFRSSVTNSTSSGKSWQTKLRDIVIIEKLNNPLGFLFLLVCSVLLAFGISHFGVILGVLVLAFVIGLAVIYAIIVFPKFGIIAHLIYAYILFFLPQLGLNGPIGTGVDGFLLLHIIGFYIRQKEERNWRIFKGPISIVILIWIIYNVIMVANPIAASAMAWVYTIRTVALVMLNYFIFVYHIRSVDFIRLIIKVWIGLTIFAAVYALKQEYIGFTDKEWAYLNSKPVIRSLLFIGGHWRKASFFAEPVAFSYNMAASAILCICLTTGPISNSKRVVLVLLSALFLWVMLFSGTRAAYVLVPGAAILFCILKYNKTVLLMASVMGMMLLFLIFMPTGNNTLIRFQSAFKPSNDASYNLRQENQAKIKPYLQTHLIGGGLGAAGDWGREFAPDSELAHFEVDSGYVRVAVESGPIGLFLICTLLFVMVKTGIENYYVIKDPELKTYCFAMTVIIFTLVLANYPQEALVQVPMSILFMMMAALITITLRLDKEKSQKVPN